MAEKRHYGKTMMLTTPDGKFEITSECAACGMMKIGPFDTVHLGSIIRLLTQMAESLGMEIGGDEHRDIEEVEGATNEEVEAARKEFERMPLRGVDEWPSAWDRKEEED